jgi:hypothetical protein
MAQALILGSFLTRLTIRCSYGYRNAQYVQFHGYCDSGLNGYGSTPNHKEKRGKMTDAYHNDYFSPTKAWIPDE